MNEFFAEAARPRVLVDGLSPEEIESIRPLCGSLREAEEDGPLNSHPEEHDVLITTNSEFYDYQDFPRRITFASPRLSRANPVETIGYVVGGNGWGTTLTHARSQSRPALNLDLAAFTKTEGIGSLVTESCIPPKGSPYYTMPLSVIPNRRVNPFLVERLETPRALAAIFEQDLSVDENKLYDSALWLPDQARAQLPEWLRWVFARWRVLNPDAFPVSAEWEMTDEWASPEELKAREAVVAFEAGEADRLAAVEVQRLALQGSSAVAAAAGDGHRQMLKGTGDSLVMAVGSALRALQFTMINADELPENQAYKKEDLRVSDGDWVAIVEVKGYGKAAKSNDLFQVTKAALTYAKTSGRDADAVWFVANIFREMDPSQRPTLMHDRPDDIATFGDAYHGLVIDTRELFKLWQAVKMGELDAATARIQLRTSAGRFNFATPNEKVEVTRELPTEEPLE